jgi:nucleotide-binding universal stress UspA family protein
MKSAKVVAFANMPLSVRSYLTFNKHAIAIRTHLVVGDEVEAIVDFLRQDKMDLLVIGLHRNTSRVARLWSTVFELEQEAPCSVLGIH